MKALHWVWLTEVTNVPAREGRLVEISGRQLAVFNLGERFVVVDNRCPHKGGPLADGIVAGDSVVCPLHGWRVNLDNGRVGRPTDAAACVATYPTRIDSGVIVVGLPATFLRPKSDEAA